MADKEVIFKIGTEVNTSGLDDMQKKLDNVSKTDLSKPFTSYKAAIRDATVEAARLEQQFGKNSKEFTNAASKVAELKDRFGEFNNTVNSFNPDNKFAALGNITKGVVSGLNAGTSALTLFGASGDKVAVQIARLQALQNLTSLTGVFDDLKNGMLDLGRATGVTTLLQKANAASSNLAAGAMKLLGLSTNASSTSFKVLKGAIIGTGIGLLVVALGALVANFDKVKQAVLNLIPGLSSIASFFGNIIDKVTDFVGITSEASRSLDKLVKTNTRLNETISNQIEQLEAQGGKEKEIYALRQQQTENELNNLREKLKVNKTLSDEEFKTFRDLQNQKEVLSITETKRLKEEQDKQADEIAKKAKESADKLKQANDKKLADNKQYQEEIKKENEAANKVIATANLTDRQKELFELNLSFEKQLELFKKKGTDTATIVEANRIKVNEINAKFDAEEAAKIAEQQAEATTKNIQDVQSSISGAFDENVTLTSTNVIQTKRENSPIEGDTPEAAKEKLNQILLAEQEAEDAAFQQRLLKAQGNNAELERIKQEHLTNQKNLEDGYSKAVEEIDNRVTETKKQNIDKALGLVSQASALAGKETAGGKALAIADATIQTYKGATSAYASLAPIPVVGPALGAVAAGLAVAGGIANVKKILAVKVPNSSSSSSSGSLPSAPPNLAPTINAIAAQQQSVQDVRVTNNGQQPIKAFITQNEMDTNAKKQNFLNNLTNY